MATLKGTTISETYPLLLKIASSGLDGTLRDVEDGDGTASALQISTGAINVNGTIGSTGAITQGSGVLTIKNATGDSNGLRIFQDTSDASKIYNHYNGTLQLGVGNTTALTIDSSERVGIGITSPSDYHSSTQLAVGNTSGEGQITIVSSSSNDANINFADGTTGTATAEGIIRYKHSNNQMELYTGQALALTLDSSQQVAIGGHSPSSLLDVRGNSSIVGFGTDSSADFGETYFASGVAINFGYGTNSNTGGFINYRGYQNGDTQFRDLTIADGKGSTVAFFDGSAKSVGIGGVTSPSSPLTVKTDSYSSNIAEFLNPGDTTLIGAYCTGNPGSGQFYIKNAGGTTQVLLNSIGDSYLTGGDVGIGTTSPTDVKGLHIKSDEDSDFPLLKLESDSTSRDASIGLITNGGNTFTIGIDATDSDKFKISDNAQVGVNDRLVIDSSGNVGINEDSPITKLDVRLDSTSTDLTADYAMFINNQTGASSGRHASIGFGTYNNGGLTNVIGAVAEGTGAQSGIYFATHNGGALTEKLRINKDGTMIIKASTPLIQFQDTDDDAVRGFISQNGTVMTLDADSDIIFSPNNSEKMRIKNTGELAMANKTNGLANTIKFVGSATYGDDAFTSHTMPASGALMFVTNHTGDLGALFFVDYSSSAITKIADPSNTFDTANTSGKIGVTKTAGSFQVTVKNLQGGSRAIGVAFIGMHES